MIFLVTMDRRLAVMWSDLLVRCMTAGPDGIHGTGPYQSDGL